MADVWYQNLEKSFKINKNIDRDFFSVDNTPKIDKTKCQLSFATDCITYSTLRLKYQSIHVDFIAYYECIISLLCYKIKCTYLFQFKNKIQNPIICRL